MGIEKNPRALVKGSMPPLKQACVTFKGFAAGEQRPDRVYQLLLEVIQRNRAAQPKRFYTMREVAAFFGIGHGTTQRIFRRLGREGTLTLVRSSQTMIPARVSRPRLAVRGVVCMPIWLPGFLQFLDWRKWFSQLEEELSRYRFILEPIFYRLNEDARPDFVDRILKFNPDYLLWSHPDRFDETIMQSIADTGVSVLVIQNFGEPFPFAGRIYWQSYEQGLHQGLREWQASGEIDRIIIPQSPYGASATKALGAALKTCPLPHQFKTFPSNESLRGDFSPLKDFVRNLTRNPRTGIIFDDDLFYAWICAWVPDEVLKLFFSHRVMVMREVVLPSLTMPPDVTTDALLFPGKQLARRIAADLNKGESHHSTNKIIFEAEWRPKIPLAEVAPRFAAE